MKPKGKVKIDELLNSLNIAGTKELMSPVKPLKRQMHIEIVNWKDDKVKDKLAIKPKDNITKVIVEFNVANREILKIRKFKGELKQLYEMLRMKQYCDKYGMNMTGMNSWLNDVMFPTVRTEDGNTLDYGKIHERIFLFAKRTSDVPMVLGVHYKDEMNVEGKLVNHAGDIIKFGLIKKADWKDITEMLKVATRKFWSEIGRLRLVVCNGTTDTINRAGRSFLKDCGWYQVSIHNRPITGYFPYDIMKKHGLNVDFRRGRVRLGEELLQYYSRTGNARPRTRSRGVVSERSALRIQVRNDMRDELHRTYGTMCDEGHEPSEIDERLSGMIGEEVDRRVRTLEASQEAETERVRASALARHLEREREEVLDIQEGRFDNLGEGTIVTVRRGNDDGRNGLSDGRTRCVIRRRYVDRDGIAIYYRAEFANGAMWNVKAEEIVDALTGNGD